MVSTNEVIIYKTPDGQTSIDVKLEDETVWLSLQQITHLFGRDKSVISRHLSNIFKEQELDRQSVVAKNATTGTDGKTYQVEYFNLDVIISVGYRVNSKRGTQFRIWANKILKDYLVKGYSTNEKRLREHSRQLDDLKQTVKLLGNVIENKALNNDEAAGLLKVITDYTYALDILDKYDHQALEVQSTTQQELFRITYMEAVNAIHELKNRLGGSWLFGNKKMNLFKVHSLLFIIHSTQMIFIPV